MAGGRAGRSEELWEKGSDVVGVAVLALQLEKHAQLHGGARMMHAARHAV